MPTGEPAVLVDGGRQDRPAVGAIPGGIVGPAAEERDAIRCPTDDHPCPQCKHRPRVHPGPPQTTWRGLIMAKTPKACQGCLTGKWGPDYDCEVPRRRLRLSGR